MKILNFTIRFYLKNKLIVVKKESTTIYDCQQQKYTLKIGSVEFIGTAPDNKLVLKDENGNGYILDTIKVTITPLPKDLFLYSSSHKSYIPVYKSNSIFESSTIGLYDFLKEELLWINKDCPSNYFIDNVFINENSEKIIRSNTINGNEIWQFSLSQLKSYSNSEDKEHPTKIMQMIGVYQNQLWFMFTGGRLVALDIKSGELKHCFRPEIFDLKHFIFGDIHLDKNKAKLVSLSGRYYWELDLDTLQAEVKKDFGEDSKNSWRIKRSRFYENDKNLYFIGAKNGENVNRAAGVFNTESCLVTWYDEPLEERKFLFFTDTPQANNKLLGVLDSEQNLRIYEREENTIS